MYPQQMCWVMRVTERGPGFNQEAIQFSSPTYQTAVDTVREEWKRTGQSITLALGPCDMYVWHMIIGNVATDRNRHSGIPETERLTRKVGA